ncbi:RNA polymerase sigma-70 factor, ECF subfamily [Roseovarius marisflavi]|uniref:RNA polymerase sigma-70 factor, ECF subfamily n=1 Tax=Roseovarius marisflavi TaxID=1054996 RepID=A0A1M6VB48_9RHOB|nr:RNA polymerase sigma factor [Roseovarius marisflavi]SHK78722.1 RNA polymerase sigma-70 factor, ECF subfamily [Roseovarius marisflavi]
MPRSAPETAPLTDLMPDLMRVARRLTREADRSQDLCQEVLLKLWVRLDAGAEIDDLRAYAMTALRNQHRQSLRRDQIPPGAPEVVTMSLPDALDACALSEAMRAIRRLPADQERLMRLVAAGETSPADLARLTGLAPGTVMSRLARARARLRDDLGLQKTGR